MDIQKMYDDSRHLSDIKDKENLEKKLRYYINGGFQGLIDIYYNYYVAQGNKYPNITPFVDFINNNDIEKFYLDEVFFEVDNKYTTNIGFDIHSLCDYYINSDKIIENKKVDLISVINHLELAIINSATSQFSENPKLYNVLKRIENYYRITYSFLYEDFYPFLQDRPINQNYGKTFLHVFEKIKETIPLKIALLFFTGKLKIIRNKDNNKFSYKNQLYSSGNSLAKVLSIELDEKITSIRPYLNETYNQSLTDKNIFNSDNITNEVSKYAVMNGFTLIDFNNIEK